MTNGRFGFARRATFDLLAVPVFYQSMFYDSEPDKMSKVQERRQGRGQHSTIPPRARLAQCVFGSHPAHLMHTNHPPPPFHAIFSQIKSFLDMAGVNTGVDECVAALTELGCECEFGGVVGWLHRPAAVSQGSVSGTVASLLLPPLPSGHV